MKIIILLWVPIIFFSCSTEDKPIHRNNEIIFNVDSSKIDKAILLTDLGISIAPPKNWLPIDSYAVSKIIQKVKHRLNSDSKFPNLIILKFFVDTASGAVLLIGNIASKNPADSIINYYEKSLEKVKDSFTFQKAKFSKGEIDLNQYLILEKDWVNFRFLGISPQAKVFQIDYVIPKSNYSPELAKAIESSLGSLSFITSNY